MERLVKFEVLGQVFPLYTDAPEADVKEILSLVKTQLEACSQTASTMSPNKLAILASINMAGKYIKLKRDFEQYKKNVDNSVDRLTGQIGHVVNFVE